MQTGSSKSLLALERCLTLWMATGLALLPLAQGLHLRFSAHDHRYCPEHHRYEDVPRVAAVARAETGREGENLGLGRSPQAGRAEVPCVLSNAPVSRFEAVLTRAPVLEAPLLVENRTRAAPASGVDSRRPLLYAPKHSPPRSRG